MAMVVAAAYETVLLTAMAVATGWRQQAFGVDEAKAVVKQNDEKLEACLSVEMAVEGALSSMGHLDVP